MEPDFKWASEICSILKILILVILLVCLGLFCGYDIWPATPSQLYLCLIFTGGYFLLYFCSILAYIVDSGYDSEPNKEFIVAIVGVFLALAAGACVIDNYDQQLCKTTRRSVALAYGGLCILMAPLFIVDAYCALQKEKFSIFSPSDIGLGNHGYSKRKPQMDEQNVHEHNIGHSEGQKQDLGRDQQSQDQQDSQKQSRGRGVKNVTKMKLS